MFFKKKVCSVNNRLQGLHQVLVYQMPLLSYVLPYAVLVPQGC